jgi:death on curing protein
VSEPVFLTLQDVGFLHQRSIERYGGTLGVRDQSGLEAAVGQPKNLFYYAQGDLFDLAAAYAFHIAQAQAFLDGNKRTAVAAALNFLYINGIRIQFDQDAFYSAMIGIAEKRVSKVDLAASLRDQARRGTA